MKFFKGCVVTYVMMVAGFFLAGWWDILDTGSYMSLAPLFMGIIVGFIFPITIIVASTALIYAVLFKWT